MLVALNSCAQPWPDLSSLSLGTNGFIGPLPPKAAAKPPATIHSAKFMMLSLMDVARPVSTDAPYPPTIANCRRWAGTSCIAQGRQTFSGVAAIDVSLSAECPIEAGDFVVLQRQ